MEFYGTIKMIKKTVFAVTKPSSLWRHLNKLRWFTLSLVFAMLVLIPLISVYQHFLSAHAYDLLAPNEVQIYDAMEWLTSPFVGADAVKDLDALKGNTWSGRLFGLDLSDPLALLGQIAAQLKIYSPFLLTALIPIVFTIFLGRFFCGWLCPATLIYELLDKVAVYLRRAGFPVGGRRLDLRFKYLVLIVGVALSTMLGTVVFSAIYPPAIIGREIYYFISFSGFGAGAGFFIVSMIFDLLVARRGFCRYLCPGGALYSLLGRYRLLRIQRQVAACDDCTLCDQECQFGLHPMRDHFGQECNNCTACIALCPTDALVFQVAWKDGPPQGYGHLGPAYQKHIAADSDLEEVEFGGKVLELGDKTLELGGKE